MKTKYNTLDEVINDKDFNLINLDKMANDYVFNKYNRIDLKVVENYDYRNNPYDYMILEWDKDYQDWYVFDSFNLVEVKAY